MTDPYVKKHRTHYTSGFLAVAADVDRGKQGSSNSGAKGFSLIEVLVSTTILVILVLAMSTIFHQSSVSWDSGYRKAEGNMSARAVLGFMAGELSHAVAFPDKNWGLIRNNNRRITFTVVGSGRDPYEREIRKIAYKFDSSKDKIIRYEWRLTGNPAKLDAGDYGDDMDGVAWGTESPTIEAELCENVDNLVFTTADGADYDQYSLLLPRWVKIRLAMKRTDDVSGVGARCAGPDGRFGTDDDIASW